MHESALDINIAGGAITLEQGMEWNNDDDEKDGSAMMKNQIINTIDYGDRRQEIVLIGVKMREDLVRRCLDAALLTDDEFNADTDSEDGVGLWH